MHTKISPPLVPSGGTPPDLLCQVDLLSLLYTNIFMLFMLRIHSMSTSIHSFHLMAKTPKSLFPVLIPERSKPSTIVHDRGLADASPISFFFYLPQSFVFFFFFFSVFLYFHRFFFCCSVFS